jgi:Ni,Fe-hydrogenase III small subunit/formate hydrogenlyase subunit 6/NADH:ubiquinone oxidoreductase subunit I
MFKILRKTVQTGLVTIGYPDKPAVISQHYRGAPRFDFAGWRDSRPAAAVCPTGAISIQEPAGMRWVTVDYGLCVYCGQCAEVDSGGAVRVTKEFELAATDRRTLVVTAEYAVDAEGIQHEFKGLQSGGWPLEEGAEKVRHAVRDRIHKVLGRSLAIREVDAGSCNGCEVEITALNSPVYDLERLGIHFVASPRHADMLLVTGPVTRNMELALVKTYRATPDPKVVVAVGACGISGGIFGGNYATLGGVDQTVPVDVYIPGCPPRPHALLHGILLALGRMAQKGLPQ